MICGTCGASNAEGAKYCAVCGSPLKTDGKKKKRRSSHLNLLLVLGAVLGGCIYGIALSLLTL